MMLPAPTSDESKKGLSGGCRQSTLATRGELPYSYIILRIIDMAVTLSEQAEIQRIVDSCNPRELAALHADAMGNLHRLNRISQRKLLSSEELKAANVAIELLTRVEAKQQGGGWWFRTKRRFQLTKLYFRP
jgi:hypothetical protein